MGLDIGGQVVCPYCEVKVDIFIVEREVDQTVELCHKCNKWFVVESEIHVETKAYKVDDMNSEISDPREP